MNIAICDNNKAFADDLSKLIYKYADLTKIEIDCCTFTDYKQIIPQADKFDLFILDYDMTDGEPDIEEEKMDGMSFARYLRSIDNEKKGIIFITAFPEFVYEAFEVRTFRFLVKPIDENDLFKALDDYFKCNQKGRRIVVNINRILRPINIDEIYFIEVINKNSFINFFDDNQKLKCHKPISYFEDLLAEEGFCRIHKSYLVNMSKIKECVGKRVLLDNGKDLYVSRSYIKSFSEKYIRFRGTSVT